MTRVYVDIDDVLSQTALAFTQLLEASFDKRIDLEEITDFDLSKSFDLDQAELEEFMREAHRDEYLMAIEPMEGAIDTLAAWHAAGHEIEVLTGRPPAAADVTRDWLEKHRVPHTELYFVDKYARYDESAWDGHAPVLRLDEIASHGYDLIIEDSLETAVRLAGAVDAEILLLDRPWNRNVTDVDQRIASRLGRCADWNEIASRVALT
jgi:uncharacterized HAD superfamily protein